MRKLPEGQKMLFCGLNRTLDFSTNIGGAGKINYIYKRIARKTGFNEIEIERTSGH